MIGEHRICPRCGSEHVERFDKCPSPREDHDAVKIWDRSPEYLSTVYELLSPEKQKIISLLGCPLNWSKELDMVGVMPIELEFFWREVASAYLDEELPDSLDDLDPENIPPTYGTYFKWATLEDEPDGRLRDEIPDIEQKIQRARKQYLGVVNRFVGMHLASREEYGKHFPPPGSTDAQVRELSKKGKKASYFYESTDFKSLDEYMWWTLDDHWKLLLEDPTALIYFDVGSPIGASLGKDASMICFDFDFSTPIAHAYPVPKSSVDAESLLSGFEHDADKMGKPIVSTRLDFW
jgi:hypothetical protein